MSTYISQATGEDVARWLAFPISLFVVSTVVVIARLHVKWKILHNLGPEDISCAAALIGACVGTIFYCEGAFGLAGFDSVERFRRVSVAQYGYPIGFNLAVYFVKLSFLLQYLRIFLTKKIRIALWISIAIIIICGAWNLFAFIFICYPVSINWEVISMESLIESGKCFNFFRIWVANASLNIATDLLIIVLPIPGIKRLMLPLGQRVGLMMMFAIGACICIVAILRLVATIHGSNDYRQRWGGMDYVDWIAVEMYLAIICSCLPTMRPLFKLLWTCTALEKGKRWYGQLRSTEKTDCSAQLPHNKSDEDKTSYSGSEGVKAGDISQPSITTVEMSAHQV